MKKLAAHMRASLGLLLIGTVLFGAIYPLLVTAIGEIIFPHQAKGSLIERNGKVIGSELLGQEFKSARYFWGRPSATTPPYNAAASTGSNFSPANPKLIKAMHERTAILKSDSRKARIPVDLITASGSGLDPNISANAAEYQIARVARARQMKEDEVRALVQEYTQLPQFKFLGEPRVNVLLLNLALDKPKGSKEKR